MRQVNKHIHTVAAFILALFSFPIVVWQEPGYFLEGSWMRAINMAVKNKLFFGTDFIFTYGPLGFLSTRNIEYVSQLPLFLGDLFLFAGYLYLYKKHLPKSTYWFLIALAAMMLMRYTNYSQNLFLVFMAYVVMNYNSKATNKFELLYCAVAGVLLFFVKVNYGIFSLALLLALAVFAWLHNRKNALLFIGLASALLIAGCLLLRVHFVDYILHSLPIIGHFDEAMQHTQIPNDKIQTQCIICLSLTLLLFVVYFFSNRGDGQSRYRKTIPFLVLLLAVYLLYKNGFTREDGIHFSEFFTTYPLFLVVIIFILGMGKNVLAAIVPLVCIVSCVVVFLQPRSLHDLKADKTYLNPFTYFQSFPYHAPKENIDWAKLAAQQRQLIGQQTVDVIPNQVFLLQYNGLNYYPRPEPQSYSAYSQELDSINALHFLRLERPQYVFITNGFVDDRYGFWDESLTRATIRTNYDYWDTSILDYSILHSKNTVENRPVFTPLYNRSYKTGDTVKMDFPANQAIYMQADVQYSLYGKAYRLFLQLPPIKIIFLFADGTREENKAVFPTLHEPLLINKYINTKEDIMLFFSGKITDTRNVTGFILRFDSPVYVPECRLSFSRLENY